MHLLRKLGLLAALSALGVFASASMAAAATYQFHDSLGNVAQAGKFGENIQLAGAQGAPITLTVQTPQGPLTNACDGFIGGQITSNATTAALKATGASHTFDNCSATPVFAAGTETLTFPQGHTASSVHTGSVGGIDILVNLGPLGICEFKGGLPAKLTNGTPSDLHVGNGTASIPVYTGTGTFSSGCLVSNGVAQGDLFPQAASSAFGGATPNVTIS